MYNGGPVSQGGRDSCDLIPGGKDSEMRFGVYRDLGFPHLQLHRCSSDYAALLLSPDAYARVFGVARGGSLGR